MQVSFPDHNSYINTISRLTTILDKDIYDRVPDPIRQVLVENPEFNSQNGKFLVENLPGSETQLISALFEVYVTEKNLEDNYRSLSLPASFSITFNGQDGAKRKETIQQLDVKLNEVITNLLKGWEEITVNSEAVFEMAEGAKEASKNDPDIVQYRRKTVEKSLNANEVLGVFTHFAGYLKLDQYSNESDPNYHTFLRVHNFPQVINGELEFSIKDSYITGKREYIQKLFTSMKEHFGVDVYGKRVVAPSD